MTSDAKVGLLAGVAGVVMVAVVYFPKQAEGAAAASPGAVAAPRAAVAAATPAPTAEPMRVSLTSRAKPAD